MNNEFLHLSTKIRSDDTNWSEQRNNFTGIMNLKYDSHETQYVCVYNLNSP